MQNDIEYLCYIIPKIQIVQSENSICTTWLVDS